MLFRNQFQQAYVTHDIEQAIDLLEHRYGITGLTPIDLDIDVSTPKGADKLTMKLAFAWVGRNQVELIQPISGCIQHYVDSLPEDVRDFRPQFNHIAMRCDDILSVLKEAERLKLPVLLEGNTETLRFLYIDARQDTGHILEYVWSSPDIWDILGWPQEVA